MSWQEIDPTPAGEPAGQNDHAHAAASGPGRALFSKSPTVLHWVGPSAVISLLIQCQKLPRYRGLAPLVGIGILLFPECAYAASVAPALNWAAENAQRAARTSKDWFLGDEMKKLTTLPAC